MAVSLTKIKIYIGRVAVLCGLSLAVFLAAFYVVNLDLDPAQKLSPTIEPSQVVRNDAELQKRLTAQNISFAEFSDWAQVNNLTGADVYDADPDKDGLPNYLEFVYGTDPNKADTDGDGYTDKQEIDNGYDPDYPGDAKSLVYIRIDKINVEAPMIWSQSTDENAMLADLEKGVSHFDKTAAPGQAGNMIVSGHSSNYIWAKGDFNHVFKDLNNLVAGDMITVKNIQKNGRIIVYHYKVNEKFVTTPDDEKIFATSNNKTLTLSTCWPLGTNLKRLIVQAELIK
jgi:sortase A